jgi:hypothetical protein
MVWSNNGARWLKVHYQHSVTPQLLCAGNASDTVVLAWGTYKEGGSMWVNIQRSWTIWNGRIYECLVLLLVSVPGLNRIRGASQSLESPRHRTGQVLVGCYPDLTYTRVFWARLDLNSGSNCMVPGHLAPIKYMSYDRILTWSVCRLCISTFSFTSCCQICDQVNFHWVVVKKRPILSENRRFSKTTQGIVVGILIWQWELKKRVEMHNLHTDHVMIRSELKYLISTKVVNLKCWVFPSKTGPIAKVRFLVW